MDRNGADTARLRMDGRVQVRRGLYRGLLPPLVGGALETGINYCIIHSLLKRYSNQIREEKEGRTLQCLEDASCISVKQGEDQSLGEAMQKTTPLIPLALASAFSGMCISFVLSPFELVKCRIQAGFAANTAHCINLTIAKEGFKGLTRGMTGTLAREIPGNAIFFTVYEALRNASPRNENSLHECVSSVMCGGTAGVVMWSLVFPIDLAKSRVQTAIPGTSPYYTGLLQHIRRAFQQGGIRSLYAGFSTTVMRAFPANAAQWMVWEMTMRQFKK